MTGAATIPERLAQTLHMALKQCRHGTMLYNVNDMFVGRSLDLYGQWCESELELLGQALRPGDVVLDVGANIGTHTVFFAKTVGSKGFVHAFEPQRLVFHTLCANVALNALVNVRCHCMAAGRQRGTIRVPLLDPAAPSNFGAVTLGGEDGELADVLSLDELQLKRCKLIKIDVEGMECDVLEGARETIGRLHPLLFVENDTVERSAEIIGRLESLDYQCYWHIDEYYDPKNFFKNTDNVFSDYQPAANMLCFHKSDRVDGLPKVTGPEDNWQKAVLRMMRGE